MNILIDDAIFHLQSQGGISTIWRELIARLPALLPDCTFDPALPVDVFIPTYYGQAPEGAKSVVMVYDFIHSRYPGLSHAPVVAQQAQAIEQADKVIAISQWTAADTKQFTGKEAQVIYPATSLDRANHEDVQAFKAKYNLPDNYVLVVGRRDLYKNVNEYYWSLKLLIAAPFTLCIGGSASVATVGYEITLYHEGMWKQINLPAAELPAAYTGALYLVYPSLYEGFGLPVLEAYVCGCPVICGSGGALSEINSAALVVDVTKPREIAEALLKMQDPGVRIEHILKGYACAKQFSWDTMAREVAVVICEVAERETA